MLRLTKQRRAILAEKFGDLATLAVAALVFGQAVGHDMFSLEAAAAGVAVWAVFTGLTYALAGGGR
jgi:hypothetical protein